MKFLRIKVFFSYIIFMKWQVKILSVKNNRPDISLHQKQIYILSGKINSGKTLILSKWVSSWQENQFKIEGIISKPIIKNGMKNGYIALDIISGEEYPLVSNKPFFKGMDWQLGKFYFNKINYLKISEKFKNMPQADLFVIDEIGPLEIYEQKGYFGLLKFVIREATIPILIVVRNTCVKDVIKYISNSSF